MNSGTKRHRLLMLGAILGVALVVALGTGALGRISASGTPAAPPDRLRIALPSGPHAALVHIAVDQGFFADEGLDVAVAPVTHGQAAMEQLRLGKADLAAAADVVFLVSVMNGEALGTAASLLSASNGNAIVARRDRGIAAPRDLAGKKIGVSFGTSAEYFLRAFQIRHQLAADSMTLVHLPPGQIAQALADGTIDAAATWPPIVYAAKAALGANALSFAERDIYRLNFLLVGRSDFLKQQPRAMQNFLRALLKAEHFMRAQPDQALQIVAARLQVGVDTLRPAWNDFDFQLKLAQSQLTAMESQARWAIERGYAAAGPIPNFLPHLHLDALLAVRPERVSVVR